MTTQFPTIQDLLNDGSISFDKSSFYRHPVNGLERPVDWSGDGFYSLDDEGIYRPDIFPTYSRIYLTG